MIWAAIAILLAQAEGGRSRDWEWSLRARAELSFDSNIFQLSHGTILRLEEDRDTDRASARFADMESASDFIFAPSARIEAKGPSPLGRKLDLFLDIEARHYFLNVAADHPIFEAGATQSIGPDGRLGLSFELVPIFFNKNYLADATDLTGNVNAGERVYEAGNYLEWQTALDYRHQITDKKPFALDGIVALGFRQRLYDSPFGGHNERGISFGPEARFSGWDLGRVSLRYRYEDVASPVTDEVLILDETFFGAVLNGDGDAIETSARSVQPVDRSRSEHSVRLAAEVDVAKGVDLLLSWERTFKTYSSNQPYDVSHRGREDTRDQFELSVRVKFGGGWEARAGVEVTRQVTDRPEDPDSTGETADYSRTIGFLSAALRW